MKFHEIPNGTYVLQCPDCLDFLAFHPDDIDRADLAVADHQQLCTHVSQGEARACTLGGFQHCHCSGMSGVCCWCGADLETLG